MIIQAHMVGFSEYAYDDPVFIDMINNAATVVANSIDCSDIYISGTSIVFYIDSSEEFDYDLIASELGLSFREHGNLYAPEFKASPLNESNWTEYVDHQIEEVYKWTSKLDTEVGEDELYGRLLFKEETVDGSVEWQKLIVRPKSLIGRV